ncbi:MAG: Ig-like domain-containing protein [Candidatus Saccharibacteria bacterium]
MSETLLESVWASEMYSANLSTLATSGTASLPGLAIRLGVEAINNPSAAWSATTALTTTPTSANSGDWDIDGTSKTNMLWWIATRPTPTAPSTALTTTTLSASPNATAAVGATVTLTASVNPAVAGTMYFYAGATNIGSGAVSGGTATLNISTLVVGSYTLDRQFRTEQPVQLLRFDLAGSQLYDHQQRCAGCYRHDYRLKRLAEFDYYGRQCRNAYRHRLTGSGRQHDILRRYEHHRYRDCQQRYRHGYHDDAGCRRSLAQS